MVGLSVLATAVLLVIAGFWWLNRRWDRVDSYYDREREDTLPSDVSSWPSGDRGF